MAPQDISAQELSSTPSQNIPPSYYYQLNQSIQQHASTLNSTYFAGDPAQPLKTYESYGNTVLVHPGESYVSTAECNYHDILLGGGVYSNHEFANFTRADMPDGFQKDQKKGVSWRSFVAGHR